MGQWRTAWSYPLPCAYTPVFHISLLKPYMATEDERRQPLSRPPPIQDDDVFLAEKLLDRREVKLNGKTAVQYLVKWQGYPLYEATWEPAQNLLGTDLQRQRNALDILRQSTANAAAKPAALSAQRAQQQGADRRSARQRAQRR